MAVTFSTPAHVADLDAAGRAGWSSVISAWLDEGRSGGSGPVNTHFYNPRRTPPPAAPGERKISWSAFPQGLLVAAAGDRQAAEEAADQPGDLGSEFGVSFFEEIGGQEQEIVLPFRRQDEYCEWFAVPAADGSTHHYVFTAEGPEYWEYIGSGTAAITRPGSVPASEQVAGDPDRLVDLYRSLVDPQVQKADLFFQSDVLFRNAGGSVRRFAAAGDYNPNNVWNTERGIVHLTQPANTLRAEVHLAADGTVLRAGPTGTPVTEAARLICCSGYGVPNRSSDPTIGADVNDLVRQGLSVSLRDPVGLYMGVFDTSVVSGPNGEDVSDWWQVIRGSGDLILRAEFGPPAGAAFGVGDVLVQGVPLRRGGQLAEAITMTLYGAAVDFGQGAPAAQPCQFRCCSPAGLPDVLQIVGLGQPCPPGSAPSFPGAAPPFGGAPGPLGLTARRRVLVP